MANASPGSDLPDPPASSPPDPTAATANVSGASASISNASVSSAGDSRGPAESFDSFRYDDGITRLFVAATLGWGFLAALFGLVVALLLVLPELFEPLGVRAEYFSFGRLRPLHTNVGLLAFVGNAIFAAVYYSTQRLCKTAMWSRGLSQLHFWSWQAIILAAAATTPLGITQGREFAEWEWPIDVALAVVWVLFFGVNFLMTLVRRRERHLYISLWFYIATIVTVPILHIVSNLVIPAGWGESHSLWAGVHDAFLQWGYGQNLLAFLLIMPFLGVMYYFLPKATGRPIFSYRLAIVHFWAMLVLYILAGPHYLHFTAIPEWLSTFGMIFGLMLWMPAWGALLNGLWTLRGSRPALRSNAAAENAVPTASGGDPREVPVGGSPGATRGPVVGFFAVALICYGVYTFEAALRSIKSVGAMVQYSDWTIAHVHVATLGWSGMLTFGMLYWMLPRLYQTELWSRRLATVHFWLSVGGLLLYVLPIYAAGVVEGVMWNRLNEIGRLAHPEFVEVVQAVVSMWWLRVAGGTLYILGLLAFGLNSVMTWVRRPRPYEVPVVTVRRMVRPAAPEAPVATPAELAHAPMLDLGRRIALGSNLLWHRRWERQPLRFVLLVSGAVVLASLLQIAPLWLFGGNVPPLASVQPYTPLELAGREIYIAEGCFHCHSQMVRPLVAETQRYGDFSRPGEFVYDRPAQWGSRRIGPDLARVGGRQSDHWHWIHLEDPRQETVRPESVMPSFAHLLDRPLDFDKIAERVAIAHDWGVPYDRELSEAPQMARDQAERIAADIVSQGGPFQRVLPSGQRLLVMDTQAVALIAYLQRLGTDLLRPAPTETAPSETAPAEAAPTEAVATENP
ncbi:cytochrome-c oxidase, cbb3-type subunit II [Candidatus Laterigemmans baculatus]|uniref:cytochrome-c oxidase, cbb3-type subunit II n=1 Tax=Candidatus Laterigemmans baculatus TaxID=2770505 RepID=UPI0013DA5CAF|nr:cytochrome-c oxidase, cbb3-type subunit II [Candidatus Laterigemmans baculatus]